MVALGAKYTHPELGDVLVIFLRISEVGSDDKEPMGFDCGPSDAARAWAIAEELRGCLKGDMKVYLPEMRNSNAGDDFIVNVRCQPGTLGAVTFLVETSVAIMRRRGRLS